jgi:hypothetical protein
MFDSSSKRTGFQDHKQRNLHTVKDVLKKKSESKAISVTGRGDL